MSWYRPFPLLGVVLFLFLSGCIAPETGQAPETGATTTPVVANVTRDVFSGRLVCGAGSPAGTANPCLFAEGSRNVFTFLIKPDIRTLLVGLTWKPTTEAGEALQVLVESRGFDAVDHEEDHRYASAAGKPDLVIRIDAADLEGDWSWDDLKGATELQARVFPARTMPPSVVVDQAFDLHVLRFYGAEAPDGADPFA